MNNYFQVYVDLLLMGTNAFYASVTGGKALAFQIMDESARFRRELRERGLVSFSEIARAKEIISTPFDF